jgi:hypothetical protein
MASDFVPKSLGNRETWLTGLKTAITNDGPTCGQTPAQVTADTALIDSILNPTKDANLKETAAVEAAGTARAAMNTHNAALRAMINRYKNATGFTPGMAAAWKVVTQSPDYDMNTQKPTITVRSMTGQNVVSGRKPGFTSVDIQMRVDGSGDWTTIGTKVSHFPFYDTTAPQTEGKPEKREYRALGYVGDNQTGQPSNIVTAVFTG